MLVMGTIDGVFLLEPEAPATRTNLSGRAVNAVRSAGEHLLAGADDGVYRSSDDGRSWTRVGLEGCEVLALEVSPSSPEVVVASTRPPAVYRSADRGNTWTAVERSHVPGGAVSGFKSGARAHTIAFDPFDRDRY